ncbi:MAG: glycosyltransferase, partial [Planctomycetes bacterium]|nr:glycosyltransferase [Planctomycetota bacterium]
VDDGSTDSTRQIAARFPNVRYHYQRNHGLSVARHVGMDLATGEIIAYTDSDCFADEDWLYYLVSKLLETGASAVGGPNLLPTHDGPVAACVSASPGTPAHILIDDQVAEHIPGCNMAFWADRLRAIDGFDAVYTKAGDDVDVCWRLQAQGERIVYAPAAMVWHHRRSTVRAYLKQQIGYGEAEALLKRKHPDKFRGFRAESLWKGRIYTRAGLGLAAGKPVINYGQFASGMFQTIYSPPRIWWPLVALSLEWWLVAFLLIGLAIVFNPRVSVFGTTSWMEADPNRGFEAFHPKIVLFRPPPAEAVEEAFDAALLAQLGNPLLILPVLMLLTTAGVSYWVAMHIAQPVERAFARYRMRFQTIRIPERLRGLRRTWEAKAGRLLRRRQIDLWSETGVGRERLLEGLVALAKKNRWNIRVDPGWAPLDITFYGDRWCKINLTTATDNHGGGRLLTRVRLRLRATLFYNAVVFLLWYVLVLGWFGNRTPEPGIDYDHVITRPWKLLMDWVADNRWELALIPVLLMILWRLRVLWWQLNRTVMASILSVAEELGMTVVGAPDLLRRPALAPAPQPPQRRAAEQPVAAVLGESAVSSGPELVPQHAPQPAAPGEPLPGLQPAPVSTAPVVPSPPVAV